MKQRKGFTLIELMIVIAIIIILAAIAIPNYLRMTDRARRARVAGDFASLATSLEAYSVDWGKYPTDGTPTTPAAIAGDNFGKGVDGTTTGMVSKIAIELTGTKGTTFPNTDLTYTNAKGNTTLTGEDGGIDYFKAGTIASMYNPFIPTGTVSGYYYSCNIDGSHWLLYAQLKTGGHYIYRTDTVTDLQETDTNTAPTIS